MRKVGQPDWNWDGETITQDRGPLIRDVVHPESGFVMGQRVARRGEP